MKTNPNSVPAARTARFWVPLMLLVVLAVLFWRSFLTDYVHFSNDGPLGQQNAGWHQLPAAMTGSWYDLNDIGSSVGAMTPTVSSLIYLCFGPVGYAKFYPPCALLVFGLGAWTFFRVLKLSPLACTLGTLSTVLSSTFLAGATWGIASVEIAMGMNFFALALIVANQKDTPWLTRWTRLALAGMCVGMNVMEGADVGALCSVLVALFAFCWAMVNGGGTPVSNLFRGIVRVVVIAGFAGFMATQTVVSLVNTSIQGIAGTEQDSQTKTAKWDWATQWSLPKTETLSLIVPGLFGYKMDTPKDMMPQFAKYYENGVYWGGVGRDPVLDRWFDSGSKGTPPPSGFMRFTGGGNYIGILVALLAGWAVVMALPKKNSPFTAVQRKMIFFWLVVLVASLLFSWGRFAPFYAVLYQLPYFSTIRNPCKFLIFFSWASVVLSAYGLHALSLRNAKESASSAAGPLAHFKNWWARAAALDRRWVHGCLAALAASGLGWLIFSSQKKTFVQYLQHRGYPDETSALEIAQFAISQAGWFVPLLAVAVALMLLAVSGYFSGHRARLGAVLLGGFVLFDLGRANLPYIVHWDYKQKYEVGALNPIVAKLTEKPYEQRVAGLPFRSPPGFELFDQLYRIEWMQHHFPYYNIQCLDIIQMPRMPADLKAYLETFSPDGSPESVMRIARRWQLTNNRYLLGPAGYLDVLNQQLDPELKRFRYADRFEVTSKPGISQPTRLEELTAVAKDDGRYALFEFTGALPRVKLYGNWQVNTNDQENLQKLADLNFDPAKTVLVSTPLNNLPAVSTNENTGTVEFKSYSPKRIEFAASATGPSILLLNDRYDANWRVTVDGQPAQLLRCNYLMRGVYLPSGQHTVEFSFSMPSKPLYITLAALLVSLLLCGLLWALTRKQAAVPDQP
jgi:hypothetical protein